MNIIIKTGFQKVSHNIKFQPVTEHKGEELCKAGHVREVEEVRLNNQQRFIIRSRVLRQTSVHSTPYETKLFVSVYIDSAL